MRSIQHIVSKYIQVLVIFLKIQNISPKQENKYYTYKKIEIVNKYLFKNLFILFTK